MITQTVVTMADFVSARVDATEAEVVEASSPFVGRVSDPEGNYWWECEWCTEGGWVDEASMAPAAQVEHAKVDHPTNPRVLAECAAIRKVLAEVAQMRANAEQYREYARAGVIGNLETARRWDDYAGLVERTALRPLASIWADHPDFRDQWRP